MKVDVVIARRVERPINANHARPRPEILPLLIVLKHHERDVAAKGEIDPVIRRFGGIHPSDRRCGSYERVDTATWDAGTPDDEAGSPPSFILGNPLCLSETDLMRPTAALALDGKKLAAFSATAGRFLRIPIGDRRCNETRASASKRPGTRAQALQTRVNSSGVAPASPRAAYRALLERCIGRPPKEVGRIFGPRRGLRLPAWPRLGHNFANDLAVSIDERHSPLRFIAAERLRGRVKRRARGGLGRVGFLWEFTPSRSTEKSWPHFRP